MNYTKKAFIGVSWTAAGLFMAQVFAYLLRLLLARNLSMEEYGLVYAVIGFFGLVAIFHTLGIGEAITKYVAAALAKKNFVHVKELMIWAAIILYTAATALAVILLFLAQWLADVYIKSPEAAILIKIYVVVMFLSPAYAIISAAFVGYQRLNILALLRVVQAAVLLIAAYVFIQHGAVGVMMSYLLAVLITDVLAFTLFFKDFPRVRFTLKKKTCKKLIAFGLPVMFTSVASVILVSTDTVLVTIFNGLEAVAIYQAALPTANILLFLTGLILTVFMPLVAEIWERKQYKILKTTTPLLYKYAAVLMVLPVIAVIAYADVILNLLFGQAYVPAENILRLLALSSLFHVVNGVSIAVLTGIGKPGEHMKSMLFGALINLILNFALIPTYGPLGAAASTVVSSFIIFVDNLRRVKKQIKIQSPPWTRLSLVILASLIFFLFLRYIIPFASYTKAVLALALTTAF
ncbi:flippase, partial [Candidatus Woesearchaeota archaeon]|nr:flippase [Candidatus Woesearchaeota archaeon]